MYIGVGGRCQESLGEGSCLRLIIYISVGGRSLAGHLGIFGGRKKRSEFFGRVFVLVLVKSIRVPFGGDLRDGLWGWSGGMRNAPY